ncbi:MAG: formylglycine-generating enzyme family protein [Cyanobacteria bacterium P01_F01_bin.143]
MAKLIIHKKEAKTKYYTEDLGDNIKLEMIAIPGGTFIMGSPTEELKRFDDEGPQHQVTVPSFYIGRYTITQAQWKAMAELEPIEKELELDPSNFKEYYEGIDRWQRPVEQVSWDDAKEFCVRLSRETDREYRLPTEAEWEYACRSGTTTPFHFGETISTELANYNGSAYGEGVEGGSRGQTTPVGYFKVANNFGLSDMHGNVREWCEDDWHDDYENAPTDGKAWFSEESRNKLTRGGSWDYNPLYCRSAIRSDSFRDVRIGNIGFRVVCIAP